MSTIGELGTFLARGNAVAAGPASPPVYGKPLATIS